MKKIFSLIVVLLGGVATVLNLITAQSLFWAVVYFTTVLVFFSLYIICDEE